VHFQDEGLLNPSIVAVKSITASNTKEGGEGLSSKAAPTTELATLLPILARLLLLAAYLAAHNAAKHDLTVFSTHNHAKKRRKGGAAATPRGRKSKHRKIARKLLGAQSFVMERMMAIFAAVSSEWDTQGRTGNMDADVGVAIATLSSLRLLVRVGAGGDLMDRGARWRICVSWEGVRSVGRSLGIEVEDWMVE
jgi:origin recognition complex subunit 5